MQHAIHSAEATCSSQHATSQSRTFDGTRPSHPCVARRGGRRHSRRQSMRAHHSHSKRARAHAQANTRTNACTHACTRTHGRDACVKIAVMGGSTRYSRENTSQPTSPGESSSSRTLRQRNSAAVGGRAGGRVGEWDCSQGKQASTNRFRRCAPSLYLSVGVWARKGARERGRCAAAGIAEAYVKACEHVGLVELRIGRADCGLKDAREVVPVDRLGRLAPHTRVLNPTLPPSFPTTVAE